tara:strand:- start:42 stop:185 length:144 start_codon:yes stop_codon:yes gene_type:complete
MMSVQREMLRVVGSSRHWLKHYPLIATLVTNPKTPTGVSMSILTRLN